MDNPQLFYLQNLILVLGIATNSGFLGTLFEVNGNNDRSIIIISGLLIGVIASDKNLKIFLLVFSLEQL